MAEYTVVGIFLNDAADGNFVACDSSWIAFVEAPNAVEAANAVLKQFGAPVEERRDPVAVAVFEGRQEDVLNG